MCDEFMVLYEEAMGAEPEEREIILQEALRVVE